MLRKFLVSTTIIFLSCMGIAVYAQNAEPTAPIVEPTDGGFQGPTTTPPINTVEQARTVNDGDLIVLKGHIVGSINEDNYLFKDETGTIRVEIEHDKWAGQVVIPENLVEIWGEVEKDWDSVQIDVDRVRVIEQSEP